MGSHSFHIVSGVEILWKGTDITIFYAVNRQKVEISLSMKVIKAFLMKKLRQIFKTFFSNVVSNFDIPNSSKYFKEEKFYSLSVIIEHFEKHPSISNIKNKSFESIFSFKNTTPEEVVQVICILRKFKKKLPDDRHSN